MAMINTVPKMPEIHPFTYHKDYEPLRSSTEVSLYEKCVVQVLSDGVAVEHRDIRPRYRFQSAADASTFQSALRGKYLWATFQVETIRSKRGREALVQHLKLWTDFNGRDGSISFLRHMTEWEKCHLEFPVTDFVHPFSVHDHDKRSIRMEFNRAAKPATRHRSGGSFDLIRRTSSFLKHRRSSASSSPSVDEGVISSKASRSYQFRKVYYIDRWQTM